MNKLYYFITDADLEKRLLDERKSVVEVAAEYVKEFSKPDKPLSKQVIHGCITYRINRWVKEKKDQVPRKRAKNKSQIDKI